LHGVGAGLSRATARPGEIFSLGPQTFLPGPSGKKCLNFSFLNGASWCTFLFLSDGGAPPNVAGPWVAYPPYLTLSTGLSRRVVSQGAKSHHVTRLTKSQTQVSGHSSVI